MLIIKKLIVALIVLCLSTLFLFTLVAKNFVEHLDIEEITVVLEYMNEFDIKSGDVEIFEVLITISEYSHWIQTGIIILLVILMFVWNTFKKEKRGIRNEEI